MPNESIGDVSEIPELVKRYATQELIDPLKALGRYIGYGLAGALCIGIGLIMLALALLRALQFEAAETFDGNLAVIPYLIVVVVALLVLGLIATRITKGLDE